MTDNGYIAHLREVKAEGAAAKRNGKNAWDNPYDFVLEAHQAYAWEDGYMQAVS